MGYLKVLDDREKVEPKHKMYLNSIQRVPGKVAMPC